MEARSLGLLGYDEMKMMDWKRSLTDLVELDKAHMRFDDGLKSERRLRADRSRLASLDVEEKDRDDFFFQDDKGQREVDSNATRQLSDPKSMK